MIVLGKTHDEWIKIIQAVKMCDHDIAAMLFACNLAENKYSELLDIEDKWNSIFERKSQMTREEANRKLESVGIVGERKVDLMLAVETLGLIKFDEPKPERSDWPTIRACGITKDNIQALEYRGYGIYKIGIDHGSS